MAEFIYREEEVKPVLLWHTDWSAIWAGAFVFTAIWAVFGALGVAIFASAFRPAEAGAFAVGMGIWEIVLTIIAMYIAGRETARLAAINSRHAGVVYGMITFGLSLVAMAVLAICFSVAGFAVGPFILSLGASAGLGWAGFLVLFFGWISAMSGAVSGIRPKAAAEVREFRPAA